MRGFCRFFWTWYIYTKKIWVGNLKTSPIFSKGESYSLKLHFHVSKFFLQGAPVILLDIGSFKDLIEHIELVSVEIILPGQPPAGWEAYPHGHVPYHWFGQSSGDPAQHDLTPQGWSAGLDGKWDPRFFSGKSLVVKYFSNLANIFLHILYLPDYTIKINWTIHRSAGWNIPFGSPSHWWRCGLCLPNPPDFQGTSNGFLTFGLSKWSFFEPLGLAWLFVHGMDGCSRGALKFPSNHPGSQRMLPGGLFQTFKAWTPGPH